MTHDPHSTAPISAACGTFDERLPAFLELELDADTRAEMEQHRASCARCSALLRDLADLTAQASRLPLMAPSRDLWSGINARLETPVVPLRTAADVVGTTEPPAGTPTDADVSAMPSRRTAPRVVSLRVFALAATVLIAVTSVMTWQIARTATTQDTRVAAGAFTDTEPLNTPAVLVANAGTVYEQEIAALRAIVDERFVDLDSTTVEVLRRNLEIIDRAILDSRLALEKDPASRVLSTTLDRALESKLELMRRVALL